MFTGRSTTWTGCNSFASPEDCYDDGDAGTEGSTCSGDGTGDFTSRETFASMAFPQLYDSTGTKAYVVDQNGDKHVIDAKETSGVNRPFSGADDTPNSSTGKAPVECMPDESTVDAEWGTVD